jgi:hypothetical protein
MLGYSALDDFRILLLRLSAAPPKHISAGAKTIAGLI